MGTVSLFNKLCSELFLYICRQTACHTLINYCLFFNLLLYIINVVKYI